MMFIKKRNFRPIPDNTSLDGLVPNDNFYRPSRRGSTSYSSENW